MTNPLAEFLKVAATVRPHSRATDDGPVQVRGHVRKDPSHHAASAVPSQMLDIAAAEQKTQEMRKRETELWQKWKAGGQQPEDLRPLLTSFRPLIASKFNVYRGRVKLIPDAALEAEFQLRFVDALRTYDPSKGSLSTYVYRYLDKAKRFVTEHQNIGRIPEGRIYKIREYKTAVEGLTTDEGSTPGVDDVARRLGWTVAETERMASELRNDLTTQGFEEDPYTFKPDKTEETLRLFKYELAGEERAVYEYLTGMGRPRLASTGEIGKKLGMPDYRVSRIKLAIQKKISRYLDA